MMWQPVRPDGLDAGRFLIGMLIFYAICLLAYRADFSAYPAKLINFSLLAILIVLGLIDGFWDYL